VLGQEPSTPPTIIGPEYRLKRSPARDPGGESGATVGDKAEETSPGDGQYIYCRQCLGIITHEAERIQVDGSHQHVQTNPHGILFEIGCFQRAEGCTSIGQATDEWSWFPGFSWRVAVCCACLAHVGWRFVSPGGAHFHGLILDRLASSA